MDVKSKYGEYDGLPTDMLTFIPELSFYNHNYYMGLVRKGCAARDLIYAESDDDNLTEFYHVQGTHCILIGYEYTDEGIFHVFEEKTF